MKTSAVICEYNPFHLGHAYQLQNMREMGEVICVMSGSFTQRGSAAILSKYERAHLAVLNGADLVLELPFPFSASSGEFFANAGVCIAERLSTVDTLCFGSETADSESLLQAAKNAQSEDFQRALAEKISANRNLSYRLAFGAVYREMFGENALFHGSNDILGFLYTSALFKLNSDISPMPLLRVGESYNGEGGGFSSATSIRKMLLQKDTDALKQAVPSNVFSSLFKAMEGGRIADHERFFSMFAAAARAGLLAERDVFDVPRELADRIVSAAQKARNMEELFSLVRTKHFSDSRIRRAMLALYFGVQMQDAETVRYTSVLAANERGRAILSRIRKTAQIPILTKLSDGKYLPEDAKRAFELSARADSVWEMLCETTREGGAMLKERPRMV